MATEWYVRVGNSEPGPFSSERLLQLAAAGRVTPNTLVRAGLSGNWVPASAVKGLFRTSPANAGPPPVPQAKPPQSGRGETATSPSNFDVVRRNKRLLLGAALFLIVFVAVVSGLFVAHHYLQRTELLGGCLRKAGRLLGGRLRQGHSLLHRSYPAGSETREAYWGRCQLIR